METELYKKLAEIVLGRGLVLGNVGRYSFDILWDNGIKWDTQTQGPIPTLIEINAITSTPLYDAQSRTTKRDKTLWTPPMVALVRALNARLRAGGLDQMTVGEFRASIENEYNTIIG